MCIVGIFLFLAYFIIWGDKMDAVKRGKFVVFEGLDLAGKTTIINEIKKIKNEYTYTKEPGFNDNVSKKFREIILGKSLPPLTEAYLFATDRSLHCSYIKEQLIKNNTVLCDRFVYSSYYYQGVIKELGIDLIKDINKNVLNNLTPDFIFYIKISNDERLKRFNNRKVINDLDKLTIKLNDKDANEQYINCLDNNSNIIIIDATNKKASDIAKKIINIIEEE